MVETQVIATVVLATVTLALPFFLKGADVILSAEYVSWAVLTRHLSFIGTGLALTTIPILVWMLPRFGAQLEARQLLFLHAFFGVQGYALLVFALSGIYHVFREKRRADLYRDPDPDANLNDLHPNMKAWRGRIRIGVFGYLLFWIFAYVAGVARYWAIYM